MSDTIKLGAAVIALATFSVAIIYGDQTYKVIKSVTDGFAAVIRAATLRK